MLRISTLKFDYFSDLHMNQLSSKKFPCSYEQNGENILRSLFIKTCSRND